MAIRFYCPKCGKPLEVDDQDAGQKVICFYCHDQVPVPQISDPAFDVGTPATLAAVPPAAKKSSTIGVVGLVSSMGIIAVIIVLVFWSIPKVLPFAQDPKFQAMTQAQQKEFIAKEVAKMTKHPAVITANILMILLALIGLICSIIGIATDSGRSQAIAGFIISALYLFYIVADIVSALIHKYSS